MGNEVIVLNQDGGITGKTFPRRAKQLVLKGRAEWTDETFTRIRMYESNLEKEEIILSSDKQHNAGYVIADEPLMDDAALLKIAQKRVRERRFVLKSIGLYVVSFIVMALIVIEGYWRQFGQGFFVGVYLTWGLYIAYKIMQVFIIPFYRSLRGAAHDPVEAEYIKLKRMPQDKLAEEYEKI
jgi:hypothetical protein